MTTRATAAVAAAAAMAALAGSLAASPASAQSRPTQAPAAQPAPEQPDPQEGDDRGGAGYLPGAQFQRKLDGGPGFVCTATNARHTDQCTASCRVGETADCVDGEGASPPSCGCTRG